MVYASFFDLDGTLTKGFLIIKFSEYLVSVKLFSKENYSRIKHLLDLFFESKITKRQVVIEGPELYALSLKDRRVDEINQAARNFVEEVKEVLLYPYAEELVKTMKKLGMTIGLSGAPSEVVKCFGEHFDFDLSYGTLLEVKKGVYTGKLMQSLVLKETKEAVLEEIIDENDIDLRGSFGFGDTELDLSFLSRVGNPVALNPNQELSFIAKQNGWTILHHGEDIISIIKKKLSLAS